MFGLRASILIIAVVMVSSAAGRDPSPWAIAAAKADGPVSLAQAEKPRNKNKARKYLTGKQVRKLVSGRTTEWVALVLHGEEVTGDSRRPQGRTYFSPDGKTEGTFNGRLRFGKWWLKKNRIFVKWDNANDTFSAVLQPDGKGGHYRVRKRDGQKRSHWKTWFDGKQL